MLNLWIKRQQAQVCQHHTPPPAYPLTQHTHQQTLLTPSPSSLAFSPDTPHDAHLQSFASPCPLSPPFNTIDPFPPFYPLSFSTLWPVPLPNHFLCLLFPSQQSCWPACLNPSPFPDTPECTLSPFLPLNPTQCCICIGSGWVAGSSYSPAAKADHLTADKKRLDMLRFKSDLPLVYMDVSIKGWGVGRIEMVLFKDSAPMAAENFRALCTGGWEVVVEPQWWAGVFCSGCVKAERQSQSLLRTHARVRLSAVHGMPALICSSVSLACPAACVMCRREGLGAQGPQGCWQGIFFQSWSHASRRGACRGSAAEQVLALLAASRAWHVMARHQLSPASRIWLLLLHFLRSCTHQPPMQESLSCWCTVLMNSTGVVLLLDRGPDHECSRCWNRLDLRRRLSG